MAQWIATIITLIAVIITIIKMLRSDAKREASTELRIENITRAFKDRTDVEDQRFEEIKHILGNGGGDGMRGELKEMQIRCAGSMATVTNTLASHQHQINEIKEAIKN